MFALVFHVDNKASAASSIRRELDDSSFATALSRPFCQDRPAISATKSLTGHSQGAAGVHEAIYTLLMMQNNFICESANIVQLDPAVEGANIVRKRIDDANINVALSNSFGFGGTNASLVFQRYEK